MSNRAAVEAANAGHLLCRRIVSEEHEVNFGRSPQQVREDEVLDAMTKTALYRRASKELRARNIWSVMANTDAAYQEWEDKLEELFESCEDTEAWKNRVSSVLWRWRRDMVKLT
jgi:hypothetical protein